MTEVTQKVRSDKLARNIGNKRAAGNLINLGTADLAQTNFTLDALGGVNDQAVVTMTLSSDLGLKLFAVPEVSLWSGSIADANLIPDGALVLEENFRFHFWVDYGSSDGNNMKCKVFIKNLTASPVTVYFRGDWRFIVEDVS